MNPLYYAVAEHPSYQRDEKGNKFYYWATCTWTSNPLNPRCWRREAKAFIKDIRRSYVELGESHRIYLARDLRLTPSPSGIPVFERIRQLDQFFCNPTFDSTVLTTPFPKGTSGQDFLIPFRAKRRLAILRGIPISPLGYPVRDPLKDVPLDDFGREILNTAL